MRMIRKNRSGFTLVEVLVAFGLLVVLIFALSMLFRQGTTAFRKGYNATQVFQSARVAMDRMERELASAFVSADYKFMGVVGGVQMGTFGPEVYFMAPLKNSGDFDLVEVGYWLKATENNLMRYYRIYNKDSPPLNFGQFDGSNNDLLAPNVVSLAIEYYDGSAWQNTWTTLGVLPKAVKITLMTADDEIIKKYSGVELLNRSKTFVDIVKLRNAK